LVQIKNKLYSNSDTYQTENFKIIYISGYIGSYTFILISPYLNQDSRYIYETIGELYIHLEELYSNPNKEYNTR
jgi:dipeptide/tripeptide permease